jgi:hypothetical protein
MASYGDKYEHHLWLNEMASANLRSKERDNEAAERKKVKAAAEEAIREADAAFDTLFHARRSKDKEAMKNAETALDVAVKARDKALEALKALGPAPASADGTPSLAGHGRRRKSRKHKRRARKTRRRV